jgi:chromosome segregation ATPase
MRESVATDTQNLKELEDFHQNITSSVAHETKAVLGLRARVATMRSGIDRKKLQISEMEAELEELQTKLTSGDGHENQSDNS